MAFRVTVLDMETGEERVFVRNACGVICAAVMPKEGEEDKYDGVAAADVAENVPIGTAGLLVRLTENAVKLVTEKDSRIRQKMAEDDAAWAAAQAEKEATAKKKSAPQEGRQAHGQEGGQVMKLKLTMTNAETGEVLQEETNLDFAMMAYGRKIEEGVDMACRTETRDVTTLAYASFLCGVEDSVKKAVCENKMEEAYTLMNIKTLMDSLERAKKKDANKTEDAGKKEGEQG